jgi:hypothetical protein
VIDKNPAVDKDARSRPPAVNRETLLRGCVEVARGWETIGNFFSVRRVWEL